MAYSSTFLPSFSQTAPIGVLAPTTPAPNATSVVTGKPVYGPNAPVAPVPTKPVTLLSSNTGADIVNDNKTKLSAVESSIVPIQNVDTSSFTPEQLKAFDSAKALIPGSPASTKMRTEIDQATAQGGMTPDERAGKDKLQSAQDAVTTAAAKARAALDAKDYTSMDYWTNKATADRLQYEKQLADYYEQTKTLRQQLTQKLTPSEKEQQLQQQVVDIRGQADAFKLQTEEDKFREYEGQTMGFAGGRASEIDLRASFKNQELALKEKNLLLSLGLEQDARKMEQTSVEKQLEYLADDYELQQKVQEKITASEEKVFERADTLQKEQKDTLVKLLDGMEGVDPSTLPPETRKQLEDMSARSGLPFDLVETALKTQHDKRVFDESLKRAQEARLGAKVGSVELAPEDKRGLAGAGFTPAEIADIEKATNDFGIEAVLKTIDDPTKKKAVQDAYGAKPKVTKEQLQKTVTQKMAQEGLKDTYTDDELSKLARDNGFAEWFTGKAGEVTKFLNSEKAKELYTELLYQQYKDAGMAE